MGKGCPCPADPRGAHEIRPAARLREEEKPMGLMVTCDPCSPP